MAKIDKMLEMITSRNIERAVLIGDRPFQLFAGGRKVEGSLTPAAQLQEILEEITPLQFLSLLRDGGAFHFRHTSPYGDFDIGAENFVGTLQVTISPAKPHSLAPKGKLYSTSQAEIPTAAQEPVPGAHDTTPQPILDSSDIDLMPAATAPLSIPPPPTPMPPAPLVSSTDLAQAGISCAVHPDRTAAGVCSYSGKFYCAECLVEIDGKNYGKENLSHVLAAAKQGTPQVVIHNTPQAIAAPVVNTAVYTHAPAPIAVAHSPRSRVVAGLLGLFFGGLGLHRFYLGYTAVGLLQILVTCISCGWGAIWGFIEGIIILCGGMNDAEGRPLQA